MKSVFLKFLLLLGFCSSIVLYIEYKYKNYETPADLLFKNFETECISVTRLYIGGSHTGVIGDYKTDSNQVVKNLSFQGFDLFKIYCVLKKWEPKMPQLKQIYIGLDYEMLGQNQTLAGEEYLDRQFYSYIDTMYKDNMTNRLMAQSSFFRANRDFSYFLSKENSLDTFIKKAPNFIPLAFSDNEVDCKKRAIEHSVIKYKTSLIYENLSLLSKIIYLSKKASIQLIIFNAPKRICFKENINKENSYLAKQKIDSLMSANQIQYYDFWNDTSFENSDFGDYDHLNAMGVEKMMNKLP